VARIKSFGSPLGDIVQRRAYVSQQNLLDATQPDGRRYYWKSEYVTAPDGPLVEQFVEHGKRIVSPHSAILLFPLQGALNRLPEDHSAVGNRKTGMVFNIAGSWDKPADDAANIAWARDAWSAMRTSSVGTYVNFLTADESESRTRDAYGANYARLAEIKARIDPDNLFRTNKNIAPEEA
jgi:hypothetical protein